MFYPKNFPRYDNEIFFSNILQESFFFKYYDFFDMNNIEIRIYFKFYNIWKTEILALEITNHLSFLKYLFPFLKFETENFSSELNRGFHYYRFNYGAKTKNEFDKLYILNFLINVFLKITRSNNIYNYWYNQTFVLGFTDLSYFSNLKLGNVSYLNNIEDRLYISFTPIDTNKSKNIYDLLDYFKIEF